MFISSFCSKSLIWVPVSFPSLLVPCIFFFISLWIVFTFPLFCDHIQPFLWTSWLPVFWMLHLIGWLSLHHLVYFGSFDLSFHLSHVFFCLFQLSCYVVRGGAAGILRGRATHVAALWCCMWGRGLRGNNASCSVLCHLSVTSPATH